MYFDSESQEQGFQVISESMKESKTCSVLNAQMSISDPGLTRCTLRSLCPWFRKSLSEKPVLYQL